MTIGDEKETINDKNENHYIKLNVFINLNHYIWRKNDIEILN